MSLGLFIDVFKTVNKETNIIENRKENKMKRKLLAAIICVSVLVSTFAVTSFAEVWGDYCIGLVNPSTDEMYYEAGIGTNVIRSETGVTGEAGVYNVYASLVTRDSGDRLVQDDEAETTDYKYVSIVRNLPNALNIVKHIRTAHIVELGTQTVGLKNVEKTFNGVEWVDCRC